jgi:hypothetical protein
MDKDETSTQSETISDQTYHKEEYVSVMDENIDESPEEEYSEEIVTFEIPIKADVQERSMSEILTSNHMPRTYKEQHMNNEFVRDQSSDSSEEEIREEIETFEIPIDMAVNICIRWHFVCYNLSHFFGWRLDVSIYNNFIIHIFFFI